jgi:hypothetical protein
MAWPAGRPIVILVRDASDSKVLLQLTLRLPPGTEGNDFLHRLEDFVYREREAMRSPPPVPGGEARERARSQARVAAGAERSRAALDERRSSSRGD